MKKIIITGASGYIGKELTSFLSNNGYFIYAFQRTNTIDNHPKIEYVNYILNSDDLNSHYFENSDYLIHTAYQPLLSKKEEDVNFLGTKKLLEKCRKHNVKFIFMSTVSAQESVTSRYSKSKLKVESILNTEKDLILKIGLVIGNGGLFLRMFKFIKKSPIIPIFDSGKQQIQYICLSNITNLCLASITNFIPGNYVIVSKSSISTKKFYSKLANLQGKKVLFINIPSTLTYKLLKFTEYLKLPLPVTSENLLGIKNMTYLAQKLPKNLNQESINTFEDCMHNIKR